MNCPICNESLAEFAPETTGPMPRPSEWQWFSGQYICTNHGRMRISGKITPDGCRVLHCWYPPCTEHGFGPVVVEAHGWKCLACGKRFVLRGLKIVSADFNDHPQQPEQLPPVSWMDFLRVEVGR
jgi:hypothetical protein